MNEPDDRADDPAMDDYFDQVLQAADARLYYLALGAALTIPDMCAAAAAPDGVTSGARYQDWCDQWLGMPFAKRVGPEGAMGIEVLFLTAADIYKLRCAFLHQGRTEHHKLTHGRVFFVEPSPYWVQMNITDAGLQLDVAQFIRDVVDAGRRWIASARTDPTVARNLELFVRRYPDGSCFGMGGLSVIA